MFKTALAYETWKHKYRYGTETPLETFQRVARAIASVEKNPDEWYDKFLHTLVRFSPEGDPVGLKCTAGGRITANVGTSFKKATLLNCFVSAPVSSAHVKYTRSTDNGLLKFPVEYKTDSSPDDLINIFLTIAEQAKTLASEGGYGICFDFIRPRGSIIKGTGVKHPGVVAYMKIWDAVSTCIVQGDMDGYVDKIKNYFNDEAKFQELKQIIKAMPRKGAMLGSLSVSHPDCEEFVRAKQQSGSLTKFNISVVITDDFMNAVENDEFFEQSFNGKVFKKIKARDLYNLIMESCYNRAEPGVLFVDNMMKNNPIAYLGKPMATNPCGEVPGLSTITTVCLLGSPNLTQYVKIDAKGNRYFDFEEYSEDVKVFHRMLDNVNDLTYSPLPSYQWVIENLRQVGMGINGLGSTLMMLGIPYNHASAIKFASDICEIKENLTWQTSALLAKEKGAFTAYNKGHFESTEFFKSDRINKTTKDLIRKYGVRNAKTTTCPPLGNSSIISDITSNGVEPVYLLEYERKVICKEWPEGLTSDNIKEHLKHHKEKDFEYWKGFYAGRQFYYEPHNRGLCEINIVRDYGYQWLLDNFPDQDHSSYLVTTKDLKIEDHLAVQKVVQYYNNQSVSKCLMKGQFVETDQGLMKIEDFGAEPFKVIGFYKSKNIKVYDGLGELTPVRKFYYGGKKPCYRISFNDGISINVGENHLLKSPEKFIKAKDIKDGDYISFSDMNYKHGKGGLPIEFSTGNTKLNHCKAIKIPSVMSEALAEVLGMWASDGYWSIERRQVSLVEKNPEIGKLFLQKVKELFCRDRVTTVTDKRDGVKIHTINSAILCHFLESMMGKGGAYSKKVPQQVLYGSYKEKMAFIRGLTLDGYYISQKKSVAIYCGVSKKLAEDLHAICLQIFGYNTYYFEKSSKVTLKRGVVNDYKTFGVSVWKPGKWVESKFDLSLEDHKNKGSRFKSPVVYVPIEVINAVNRTKGVPDEFSIRGIWSRQSPYIFRKTAEKLKLSYVKLSRVTSVEYLGEQETFDIEVDGNHEYLVSNIITHNTCNLPKKFPFEDFKELYIRAWKAGLNGFTTYREGSMESVLSDINKAENRELIKRDIKLPDIFINGPTHIIKREGKKFYLHFSYLPEDSKQEFPIVIWIHTNAHYKADELRICNRAARNLGTLALTCGIDRKIVNETVEKANVDYPHNRLGRMVSLCLRHNVPREDILVSLMNIDGDNISTLLTAVRKFLSKTLPDGTKLKGLKCPECKDQLIMDGGCQRCPSCSWSACG